jgi:glycosyltransferase involved in cell wall biosynthesis
LSESEEVSVVVPTFNGKRFIADALNSVMLQNRQPNEVVVVDDCSTDGTLDFVTKIGTDLGLSLVMSSTRTNSGGPAHPLSLGIEIAKGPWILILEQDDILSDGSIADRLNAVDFTKDGSVVCGRAERINASTEIGTSSGGTVRPWPDELANCEPEKSVNVRGQEMLGLLVRDGMFINGFPGIFFKKEAWAKVGGLDASFSITADFEFSCRLASSFDFQLLNSVCYRQRLHSANLTKQVSKMHCEDLSVRERYLGNVDAAYRDACLESLTNDCLLRFYKYWKLQDFGAANHCLRVMGRISPSRLSPRLKCARFVSSVLAGLPKSILVR